jgi:hypothetical protein
MSPQLAGERLAALSANFHAAQAPAPPAEIKSAADAVVARAALSKDPAFVQKYMTGDAGARRQMAALNALLAGADESLLARSGASPPEGYVKEPGVTAGWREMAAGAGALRELGISEAAIAQVLQDQPEARVFHDMARQRKAERMGDADWLKRYLTGEFAERKEMTLINIILSGGVKEAA